MPDRRRRHSFSARTLLWAGAMISAGCSSDAEREGSPTIEAGPGAPAESLAEWRSILAEVRSRFADADQISIDDLALRMESEAPLVIDVRAPEEYAVSHIPGARSIPWDGDFTDAFEGTDEQREIVLYCSVGWRSSDAATELQKAGFERVHNLEGSIFAWANAGQALENDAGQAALVHPFNAKWGKLLRSELRAPLPR